ncbi:hypothetical protein BX616_009714 [Lobosporangium transversale]|uniref:Uncharacterized protein n=1 Tax=Lobosporangium transversale TaxID=64571 RepID=A0A1Y2H1Y4_9FUNG|nr:hypothetical protein BCR41DRAFT_419465 [Lobosporangium transversale]KAF9913706.1 hypothetical protein BX616_009714 [Lobosporangium transversale]ORZ27052.1 hypothetical protein BCR41DRAFT_419465 [Lobosporangium transversale]|eukprot:XP_021884799.1 hypothetical protein BCR41DRAFT_419465 [Lobosporangium transversale]
MQSPASSIQSPRPQGRPSAQPQVPFDKELMTSLHVLLNQLGEVERQGLVMFHKIEESFKHPYTQQEAIADTANLLTQLDTLSNQAKATGFSALTILPNFASNVVSTPSASSSSTTTSTHFTGTPKPNFMSPRMQSHIHNNLNTQHGTNNNSTTGTDTTMFSPGPAVSLVNTPAGSTPASGVLSNMSIATTTGALGAGAPTPTAISSTVATPVGAPASLGVTAPSPFPSSDVIMSSSTPTASGALDPSTPSLTIGALPSTDPMAASTPQMNNPATPATPSGNSTNSSSIALSQMMDARQRDVNAQFAEKRKLRANFKVAAQMTKI